SCSDLRSPFQTVDAELRYTQAATGYRNCPTFRRDDAPEKRSRPNAQARRARPIRRLAARQVHPRDPLPCRSGRTLLPEAFALPEAGYHLRAAPIPLLVHRSPRPVLPTTAPAGRRAGGLE